MDSSPCPECRAVHRELQEALAAAKERLSSRSTTPDDLAAWVQDLDEEQCARMRKTWSIWAAWRRWQEHRVLTGHYLSPLPVPPHGTANPN